MRGIFSSILLMFGLVCFLSAQDENVGFLRFVNLVDAGKGATYLQIDGEEVWKPGYEMGQKTGSLGYKAGTRNVLIQKEGCLPAQRKVLIESGSSQTLIGFAEEKFDEEGVSLGWQMKLARLKQYTPESGFVMSFISFCKEPKLTLVIEELETKQEFVCSLKRMQVSRLQLATEGRVRALVKCQSEPLGMIKVSEVGHYVVILYEGDEGTKKLRSFYDPEFLISDG